jgi:Domain of unknown function (DUF4345)
VFLLRGVGRLVSLAVHGPPHWFQTALGVIELVTPLVLFWLAGADEEAADQGPGTQSQRSAKHRDHVRPG